MQIDVLVRCICNAEGLNSSADSSDEDEEQKKQYESASSFADALSRIGDMCRGVPMTLSVEQYLKKDNGMDNRMSRE